MTMKREKMSRRPAAAYPTLDEVHEDRRSFLKLLGRGALGVSVFGLAACEAALGGSDATGPGADAAVDAGHFPELAGIAPADIQEPDIPTLPDTGEPPLAGGISAPDAEYPPHIPDVVEPPDTGEMPLPGEPPIPDDTGTCPTSRDVYSPPPDTGEIPLPGEMVEPDAGVHAPDTYRVDTGEEPPIDGDMEIPSEG